MKKRSISTRVLQTYWENETIDKLIEQLQEAKKKGATNVNIEDNEGDGAEVYIYYNRLETDDEFETRKLKIEKHKKEIEKKELANLARLKAKYESNGQKDNTDNL